MLLLLSTLTLWDAIEQLEEEETVIKEKIAHLPEDIDKKVHYKHRKDEHFTDKNAFHHDTNKPDVPKDKGYHDAMFQVSLLCDYFESSNCP